MSINKAEGKHWTLWAYTFAVFSHGQLYVALSRARTADCIKILIKRDVDDCSGFVFTKNVVYDEILALANSGSLDRRESPRLADQE